MLKYSWPVPLYLFFALFSKLLLIMHYVGGLEFAIIAQVLFYVGGLFYLWSSPFSKELRVPLTLLILVRGIGPMFFTSSYSLGARILPILVDAIILGLYFFRFYLKEKHPPKDSLKFSAVAAFFALSMGTQALQTMGILDLSIMAFAVLTWMESASLVIAIGLHLWQIRETQSFKGADYWADKIDEIQGN
ncbi:MAG: hypothetical protein AAFR61_09535 [Bacteroidota bacterium]